MKLGVAVLLPTIVIFVALLYPELTEGRLDNLFLFLVVLVILILLLPWARITSLKPAGVEIALDHAKVDRVIEAVKGQGNNIADKDLHNLIKRLEPQIEQATRWQLNEDVLRLLHHIRVNPSHFVQNPDRPSSSSANEAQDASLLNQEPVPVP